MNKTSEDIACALVQADTRWADRSANRSHLADLMDEVSGIDLYVLPETCTTGFLGDCDETDPDGYEKDLEWLGQQADARRTAIACSLVAREQGRVFNRFVLACADGRTVFYDKRHLFGFGGEGGRYSAGTKRQRTELDGWCLDLQICYDLRFPVWCRNNDAFDVQIFVANWPRPRIEHWLTLLRARAIENQAFVIGLNRVGTDGNDVDHPGASVVFDPLGEPVVGPLDESEQVAEFNLSAKKLSTIRSKFPFLADQDTFSLS